MEAVEAVRRLKMDLASACRSGEASRLLGVIVTPEVFAELIKEEGFHGVVGVRGREGNRRIRYEFYILVNSNFPSRAVEPYFTVCYPADVYKDRYLGREDEILAAEVRRSTTVPSTQIPVGMHGSWYSTEEITISEINPIIGMVGVKVSNGARYYYNVDYDLVLAEVEKAKAEGLSPRARIAEVFERENLVLNPPETEWIKDEASYDWDRASETDRVGRVRMRKQSGANFQIIATGLNGFGQQVGIVAVEKEEAEEFARSAVHMFLPEEVYDFLIRYGVDITLDWIRQIPVREWWGTWYDEEELGRLSPHRWLGGKSNGNSIDGSFIGTRGKAYHFDLVRIDDGQDGWEEAKAKHFPADWQDWPKTKQMANLEAIATTL